MAGGGAQQPDMQYVQQAAAFEPLEPSNIQANMGPQFGPTATPNPYVSGNTPDWAQGAFAMPWWGLDPFGQPLTQEQMMYQAPPAPAQQAPAQQAPGISPQQLQQLQYQDYLNGRSSMEAQIAANSYGGDDSWNFQNTPSSLYGTEYDPRKEWQRKPEASWNNYDRQMANQQKAAMRAAGFDV